MGDIDLLRGAINGNRVIRFHYDGTVRGTRVAYPHILFESSAGNICIDAWQVDGVTSSAALPEWRQFAVGKMSRIEVLDERFTCAPGYNPANGARYRRTLARCEED